MNYKQKYLKYKLKYLNIKGGAQSLEEEKSPKTSKKKKQLPSGPKKVIKKSRKSQIEEDMRKNKKNSEKSKKPRLDSIYLESQSDSKEELYINLIREKTLHTEEDKKYIKEQLKVNEVSNDNMIIRLDLIKDIPFTETKENDEEADENFYLNMKDFFTDLFNNKKVIFEDKYNILGEGGDKTIYQILDIEKKNTIIKFINSYEKLELPPENTKLVLSTNKDGTPYLNFDAIKLVNKICDYNCNNYLHLPYIIVESSPSPFSIESHPSPFSIEKQMDGDLFSFVAREKNEEPDYFLTFSQRIEYIYNILLALNCLHSKGYCHLDIKLENFLCEKIGDTKLHIKLADFDLLKKFDDLGIMGRGSPRYTDPIVLQNLIYNDIPEYNDLYAVGVIWYVFIYKDMPFELDENGLLKKDIFGDPKYICKIDFYKDLEEKIKNEQDRIEVDFIKKLTSNNLDDRVTTLKLIELIEPYVKTVKRKL